MNFVNTRKNNYSNSNYKLNKENSYFSNRNKTVVPKEYIATKEEFPNIHQSHETRVISDEKASHNKIEYAKIAAKEIKITNPNHDDIFGILKPGILYLKYDKQNNKIIRREGPQTESFKKMEKRLQMENTLNYRMNVAIQEIDKRRQQYIEYYEYMNGEGSYEDFFKIQQNTIEDSDEDDDGDMDNELTEDEI